MDSPCIGICKLDLTKICIGCGRNVAEIMAWPTASEEEQREIAAAAQQRLAARQKGADASEFPID